MRLLIVNDHTLYREGLANIFNRQPGFEVVGEADSVREAYLKARGLSPDLVLMSFSLRDGTGLEATKQILTECPEVPIVFLTHHEDEEQLFAAIRVGAKGYLHKNLPVSKLVASLRGLEKGEAAISRRMTTRLLSEFSRLEKRAQYSSRWPLEILTNREMEVFQELAVGATNKEIAERLIISENTVKNHVHSILDKLKLKSRREVALFAFRNGLRQTAFLRQHA